MQTHGAWNQILTNQCCIVCFQQKYGQHSHKCMKQCHTAFTLRASLAQSWERFVSTSGWMAILVQQHNWVLLKIIIEIVARKAKLFAQKPAFLLADDRADPNDRCFNVSADKQLHVRGREGRGRHNSRFLRVYRLRSGANCRIWIGRCAHITITYSDYLCVRIPMQEICSSIM